MSLAILPVPVKDGFFYKRTTERQQLSAENRMKSPK